MDKRFNFLIDGAKNFIQEKNVVCILNDDGAAEMIEVNRQSRFNINETLLPQQDILQLRTLVPKMTDKKLVFKEVTGDLFSAPSHYALGHCVAEDLKMGKGIAIKFKNSFGKLDELARQKKKVGEVAVLKHNQRYVYYLITKRSSWGKPTYESLSTSVHAMRDHMVKNGVRYLALPKIGCGLDGLNWDKVKELLLDIFKNDDLEILIYHYAP